MTTLPSEDNSPSSIRSVDDFLDRMRPYARVLDGNQHPSIYRFPSLEPWLFDLVVTKKGDRLLIRKQGFLTGIGVLSVVVTCQIRSFEPLHCSLNARLTSSSQLLTWVFILAFTGLAFWQIGGFHRDPFTIPLTFYILPLGYFLVISVSLFMVRRDARRRLLEEVEEFVRFVQKDKKPLL